MASYNPRLLHKCWVIWDAFDNSYLDYDDDFTSDAFAAKVFKSRSKARIYNKEHCKGYKTTQVRQIEVMMR